MSIYKWFDCHPGLSLSKRISSKFSKLYSSLESVNLIYFLLDKCGTKSLVVKTEDESLTSEIASLLASEEAK